MIEKEKSPTEASATGKWSVVYPRNGDSTALFGLHAIGFAPLFHSRFSVSLLFRSLSTPLSLSEVVRCLSLVAVFLQARRVLLYVFLFFLFDYFYFYFCVNGCVYLSWFGFSFMSLNSNLLVMRVLFDVVDWERRKLWRKSMDFSSPVAKRTRLQEALVYRRLYEEKKRNAGVSSSGSHNDDGVEFLGEAGVFDSVQKFVAESDGKNSDRKNSSRKKNGGENSDEDVTDVVSISDDSEASDYEEEEDDDDDDYIVDPTIDRDERGNQASKLGKKKVELGTSSHPFCVDVDEGEGDGDGEGEEEWEEEEEEEEEEEGRDSSSGHAEFPKTIGRKDKGELGKHTKRKRIRALKHCDALKILVDSIWAKNSGLLEELVSPRGSDSIEETAPAFTELPLKFKFGVDESIPLGKSQPEIGMNQLWAEFDFVLRSAEIGSKETNVVGWLCNFIHTLYFYTFISVISCK